MPSEEEMDMKAMLGLGLNKDTEQPTVEQESDKGVWTREKADELLKEHSFSLKSLGENVQPANILPGRYNENQGVIIYANENGVFAIPSSMQARSLIQSGEYTKDESIGVPNLNNAETWSEAQKAPGGSFHEWKKLSDEVENGVLYGEVKDLPRY